MKIYIQSNRFQQIAAKVSEDTFKSFGLKTEIILVENFSEITNFFGSSYIRKGKKVIFKDDLQSFTLLRFLIPKLSKSNTPIMIVDPDIFAINDPRSILNSALKKDKIYCTFINNKPRTEMMVLNPDNNFWDFDKIIKKLFSFEIDYDDLFNLNFIEKYKILEVENKFNSLDKIDHDTVLLHTTNRRTQPWKEGLKIDFQIYASKFNIFYNHFRKLFGLSHNKNITENTYQKHPDQKVIQYIIDIFNKAYQKKIISKSEILDSVEKKYISQNFLQKLDIN